MSAPAPARVKLTSTQRKVCMLSMQGLSYREIGERLGSSEQTVKNHMHHVYRATGTDSRLDLVMRVLRKHPELLED